jgi:hypothetical protein
VHERDRERDGLCQSAGGLQDVGRDSVGVLGLIGGDADGVDDDRSALIACVVNLRGGAGDVLRAQGRADDGAEQAAVGLGQRGEEASEAGAGGVFIADHGDDGARGTLRRDG